MRHVTKNDTMISKRPQVSYIDSYCDEYTQSNLSFYGREKASLKQIHQTRQLVHPYNIVKNSPETFSWKQVMGVSNNRKRKLETNFNFHSNEMSSVFNSRHGNFHHLESSIFTNVTVNKSFFPNERNMSRMSTLSSQNSIKYGNNSRSLKPIDTRLQPETSYYNKCLNAIKDVFDDDDNDLARNDGFKVPNSFPKRRKVITNNEMIFKGTKFVYFYFY